MHYTMLFTLAVLLKFPTSTSISQSLLPSSGLFSVLSLSSWKAPFPNSRTGQKMYEIKKWTPAASLCPLPHSSNILTIATYRNHSVQSQGRLNRSHLWERDRNTEENADKERHQGAMETGRNWNIIRANEEEWEKEFCRQESGSNKTGSLCSQHQQQRISTDKF